MAVSFVKGLAKSVEMACSAKKSLPVDFLAEIWLSPGRGTSRLGCLGLVGLRRSGGPLSLGGGLGGGAMQSFMRFAKSFGKVT